MHLKQNNYYGNNNEKIWKISSYSSNANVKVIICNKLNKNMIGDGKNESTRKDFLVFGVNRNLFVHKKAI